MSSHVSFNGTLKRSSGPNLTIADPRNQKTQIKLQFEQEKKKVTAPKASVSWT
jgi:hypothetical protein